MFVKFRSAFSGVTRIATAHVLYVRANARVKLSDVDNPREVATADVQIGSVTPQVVGSAASVAARLMAADPTLRLVRVEEVDPWDFSKSRELWINANSVGSASQSSRLFGDRPTCFIGTQVGSHLLVGSLTVFLRQISADLAED